MKVAISTSSVKVSDVGCRVSANEVNPLDENCSFIQFAALLTFSLNPFRVLNSGVVLY